MKISDDESRIFTEETMAADLIEVLIGEIKAMPNSWQKLSHDAQLEVLNRLRKAVYAASVKAIIGLASGGRNHVIADLESIAIKDKIKAVFNISPNNDEMSLNEFYKASSKPFILMLLDAAQATGDTAVADHDQSGLSFN